MTQEEKINKLIAEFMGMTIRVDENAHPTFGTRYWGKCWIAPGSRYRESDSEWACSAYSNSVDKFYLKHMASIQTYHSSWEWLMPAWRKIIDEIGLYMMTNGYEKLWLEKSKKIETAIVQEVNVQRASMLISQIIQWYNQSTSSPTTI